jgi:hypothetical protein
MDFMALWLAQQFGVDAARRQSLRQGPSFKLRMARLIHGIAIKTSGGECLGETKQHFL